MAVCRGILKDIVIYWRSLLIVLTPIVLSPIPIVIGTRVKELLAQIVFFYWISGS